MSKLPPSMISNNLGATAFNTSKKTTEVFQTVKNNEWQPASLLKRYIASIIDQLIATVFIGLMKTFFIAKFFHNPIIASFVLIICYFGIYWIMIPVEFGATPGKKAMGLRIVSKDGDINPGYIKMILRETIGRFISIVSILGYIWVFFSKDKSAWHDLIAKTKVIQYR